MWDYKMKPHGKLQNQHTYTQWQVVFLNMGNENSHKEIKKTVLFVIASKSIKYLGINLTKERKDLYIDT